MDNNYQSQKNWWARNWKWFVPTTCLVLLLIYAFYIIILLFGITSFMKNSDAYIISMNKAQNNRIVIDNLGFPLETDGLIGGSIELHNSTGNCDIQIPVKGSKGKGTIFVIAVKKGEWKFSKMSVLIKKTKEEINLIQPDKKSN